MKVQIFSLRPFSLGLSLTRLCAVALLGILIMKPAMGRGQARPNFPPYQHQEAVTTLAASQNNFTRDIYAKLANESSGNLFFSPFSIMTALGMTLSGARGNTEQEMRSVMHLTQENEALHNAFMNVVADLKTESPEYELRTSNMAYVSDQMALLKEFASILDEKYLSTSKTVNFGDGENVRQEINSAVEKETNSRIKDLIPSGVLNALTRMVLVNAVYFKGLWEQQFSESNTYDQEFWTSATENTKVPMMHIKKKFNMVHRKDLEATVLSMDYKGSRLSMVFVLPDERDGLSKVEGKLSGMDLREIDNRLHNVEVEVTLPKFKLEESLELVDHLRGMGIKDLFDEEASDLSGISGKRDLFVSKVIHKAFLEVNEKGSEAAAATGMVMQLQSYTPPRVFAADHPFSFFIRDSQSGIILFMGRYVKA